MRKLFLVLILTSLAIACKKDSNQFSYPSIYYNKGIKDIQPLRVFTVNGEIRDQAVIDRIERVTDYFTPKSLNSFPRMIDSILLSTASEITLFGLYLHGYRICRPDQSGNDITFTALLMASADKDTTVAQEIIESSFYYPRLYSNKRDPHGPFYLYDLTEQYFATLSSTDELIIPVMVIMVPESPSGTYFSRPFNNRFNPRFNFKLLGSKDTFAVREYTEIMQKVH